MNNKQVQTSREIRLWITGIIGPLVIGAATIYAQNPELMTKTGQFVKRKGTEIKGRILRVKGRL